MKGIRRYSLWAVALLCILCGCAACGNHDTKDEKPVVTVSIAPQQWLLERIAGPDLEINTLLPAGVDAETYEPSIRAMQALEKSCEYAMVGTLPFEQAQRNRLADIYPGLRISQASTGMKLIYGTHSHSDDSHGHDHQHMAGEVDPHVWTTPENLRVMADSLLAVALRANPAGVAKYQQRHALLVAEIDSLSRELDSLLMPLRGRDIVIWHPSLAYLAHDYNLHQLSVQQGHKEPTPRQMAEVIDHVRDYGALALIVENQHSPRMAMALNADMRLPLVQTDLMSPDILTTLLRLARDLNDAYRHQPHKTTSAHEHH